MNRTLNVSSLRNKTTQDVLIGASAFLLVLARAVAFAAALAGAYATRRKGSQ